MQWIYSIGPKQKAAFILALVFVIVLGNNLLSKQNVSELGSSFSSVYEDRLLVESYIFKLSDLLYRKKIILDKTASPQELLNRENTLQNHNAQINLLLTDYEKTRLTATETVIFESLKSNITDMEALERSLLQNIENEQEKAMLDMKFNTTMGNLNQLSQIQVSEGKLLNDESKKSIAGFTLLTQFETGLLIVLGLLIQALIFTSRSIIPKTTQKHSLN